MAYLLCRYLKYNRIQAHKCTKERREERATNILKFSSEILVIPNVSAEKDVQVKLCICQRSQEHKKKKRLNLLVVLLVSSVRIGFSWCVFFCLFFSSEEIRKVYTGYYYTSSLAY